MKKLSWSQMNSYNTCNEKWRLHYAERLRSRYKSGALLFGTAMDRALEQCVLHPEQSELEIYEQTWLKQDINGRMTHLPDSLDVVYAQSDFDYDLLDARDHEFLKAKQIELGFAPDITLKDLYETCLSAKKQRAYRHFSESANKFLNLCCWHSLRQKGLLMLKAHRKEILPHITKVISTQAEVKLDNGEDSLVGYADLVCEWDGDAEPIILDYKTSTIPYELDSAATSGQLALYSHALGIPRVGFIVFRKGILKNKKRVCSTCGYDGSASRARTCDQVVNAKRCEGRWTETLHPSVDIQIIQDRMSSTMETAIIENLDHINRAIDAKVFVKNFNACRQPWGLCDFFNLCHKGSLEGLEKVEETKKV